MERVSGERTPGPALYRLLDELADDLMALTDAELLAELSADGVDLGFEADATEAAIAAGMARAGRERLAAAKAAVARDRGARTVPAPMRAERRDAVLAHFARSDPNLRGRLTMAARNGGGMTEAEVEAIAANLRELGAIDDDGNPV